MPREQAGVAKTEAQPFIQLVFGNQIEFVADMAAGTGVGGNRNRSAAGVEVVMRGDQPKAFKRLLQYPFFSDVFFHSDPKVRKIPAAHLIGEAYLS